MFSASSPPGLGLRRLWVAFSAAYAVSSAWHIFTPRGTFHRIVSYLTGVNWSVSSTEIIRTPSLDSSPKKTTFVDSRRVNESDLDDFIQQVEKKNSDFWELICEKETSDIKYAAWRNILPHGGTQYYSSTIVENASADLTHAFYNHDECRLRWDNLLSCSEVIETDSEGVETVWWLRRLPVCGPREYVFGRRNWTVNGNQHYTITKATQHPTRPPSATDQPMQVQTYYSSWLIHPVAGRNGTPNSAVETILIHYEEMGIPQGIARFAVRNGMWRVVKNLCQGYRDFEKAVASDPTLLSVSHTPKAETKKESMARSTSVTGLKECQRKEKVDRKKQRTFSIKRIGQIVGGLVLLAVVVNAATIAVEKYVETLAIQAP
eukprot:CAMPEP_0196571114 /NCGR_PEP_ID=MMETSP1081-20130531/1283_1 /TAXON_ID=36882 /ORGANISM="Pyramimonas amylifera, Strain CCMP720" /LENGTH=375 /DNA_ID=CAMNT_0041887899 /DNA_START=378 /DNA_END=1506 /DNA_ORIENTATION=+